MPNLLEKSKVAKAVGGPEMIRRLPKLDRLKIGLKIAEELGNETAVKACAKKLFQDKMKKEKYLDAIEIAKRYGLSEQLDEVSHKIADEIADIYADEIEKYVPIDECYALAAEIAEKFGLGEECLKQAALKVFEHFMRTEMFSFAAIIAKKHGLVEELKKAGLENIRKYMRNLVIREEFRCYVVHSCFSESMSIADECGVEKDAVKQAALEFIIPVHVRCAACGQPTSIDRQYTLRIAEQYGLDEEDVKQVASGIIKPALGDLTTNVLYFPNGLYHIKYRLGIRGSVCDEVMAIAKEYGLYDEELKKALMGAYNRLLEEGRYPQAIGIAKSCGFETEMREAQIKHIEAEMEKAKWLNDYRIIANIAKGYDLIGKMKEAALKAFEQAMEPDRSGKVALEIAEEYDLTEKKQEAALRAFGHVMSSQYPNYARALEIAEKYGLDEQKKRAALELKIRQENLIRLDDFMKSKEFLNATEFAKQHGLEERLREMVIKSVETDISQQRYYQAVITAEHFGLEDEKKKAARKAIEEKLAKNDYDGAKDIAERFGLDEDLKHIEEIQKLL